MGAWANVAELVKTKTLQGGLVVRPTSGLPFLLEEGMEVVFVPPLLVAPKSAVVKEVSFIKDDVWFVRFEGVDSLETAEQLAGRFCLVRKDDLPEGFDASAGSALVGCAVVDEAFGELGVVAELVEKPAQLLLSVVSEEGEILIPAVDEFVQEVDEDARIVRVSVPWSLVELGRKA